MPQYALNRDATHRYRILEKFEAGIALRGSEVKSIKAGNVSLKGSYASMQDGHLWLINAHIGRYKPAGPLQHELTRSRRLLARRAEIDRLVGTMHGQGVTIVPLSLYSKRGLIKVELGLARGKKAYDKRADIKKREIKRKIERALRVKE